MKYVVLAMAILIPTLLLFRDIPNPVYSFVGDEYAFYWNATYAAGHLTKLNPFSYRGVYGYHPVADSLFQAIVMKIAGVNLTGWKTANIAVLIISSLFIYLIAHFLWKSPAVSILAVIFFAYSHYLLAFAHIGYNNLHAFIPALTAGYFYLRFARRHRITDGLLCGAGAGLCFYTFYTAQIIAILTLFFVLTEQKNKRYVLAAFILTAAPVLATNVGSMRQNYSVLTAVQSPLQMIINLLRYAESFVWTPSADLNHYMYGALVWPPLTALFLWGLWRMKSVGNQFRSALFLGSWFAAVSFVAVTTFHQNTVPLTRLHLILPPVALVGAYGFRQLLKSGRLLAGIAVLYISFELFLFYVTSPAHTELTPGALTLILAAAHPSKTVCIESNHYDALYSAFQAYNIRNIRNADMYPGRVPDCDIVGVNGMNKAYFSARGPDFLRNKRPVFFGNPANPANRILYFQ